MKYKTFDFIELNNENLQTLDFINTDTSGWRIFYSDKKNNYIKFYPFGEFQGGGQPYLINIENNECLEWIMKNPNFETEIRKIIDEKTGYNTWQKILGLMRR